MKHKIQTPLAKLINAYFDSSLDLRVRLFNILAIFGVLVSLISAIVSFCLNDSPVEYGLYMFFSVLSAALLIYSAKTGG